MDEILFNIFFWGVLVFGGGVFVCFCFVKGIRQCKDEIAKKKAGITNEPKLIEDDVEPSKTRATVIDQMCAVRTVGIKTPKTLKEFVIIFQTENGETLKLNVPEEMYDGFEKGQTGILSLVNGELYSFVIDE